MTVKNLLEVAYHFKNEKLKRDPMFIIEIDYLFEMVQEIGAERLSEAKVIKWLEENIR